MAFSVKTPLMVAMVGITLGLTGCGGSDDNTRSFSDLTGNGSTGTGNSNTGNAGTTPSNPSTGNTNSAVLSYSDFNDVTDSSSNLTNITRYDITFSASGVSSASKGLLMPYTPPTDEGYDHEIGDHYLESHLDSDITSFAKNMVVTKPSSDKYSITYNSVSSNNQTIAHTMMVKEIDISGVYDFAQKESQGFYAWADNRRFDKLPASITYPAGSSCFVFEQTNQDKVTYGFEDANVTQYTDLDSFLNAQNQVVAGSVKKYNVGLNNEWQVVEYQESNSESPDYAVLYNGKVYQNAYKNDLTNTENSDITKGKVTCDLLNPVAANTMEQALVTAYK